MRLAPGSGGRPRRCLRSSRAKPPRCTCAPRAAEARPRPRPVPARTTPATATCRQSSGSRSSGGRASLLPLRRLLWAMSKSSDFRARHCVVAWADGAAWGRGNPAATYLLSCLGSDSHPDVRQAASRALPSIGAPQEVEAPAATPTRTAAAFVQFMAFAVAGGDGSPALRALLPRARASVVGFAASALRQIHGAAAVPTTRSLPRLCEVSPVAGAAVGPAGDASGAIACALATATLGFGDASSSDSGASFLAAFAALVESADTLLDETADAPPLEGGHGEAAPSVAAASCLFLGLSACAQALHGKPSDDVTQALWRGLPGTLLRRFAAQTHRFAALAGHGFDRPLPAHAELPAAGISSSSGGVGRAASDATAAALAVCCSELLGVLAPFAPRLASVEVLANAAAVLESEAAAAGGSAAGTRGAARHGSALGARRAAAMAALATVGALAAALHAPTAPLGSNDATAASGEAAPAEAPSEDGRPRALRRAVAAAGALVGCADTEVHLAAARAVTRAATFYAPLPSEPDEMAPGAASAAPPAAGQYTSVEAAAAAGDRAAVRCALRSTPLYK